MSEMSARKKPDSTPAGGVSERFVDLVDDYLDRVFRFLASLCRDEDLARELTHDTFLKLRGRIEAGVQLSEAYIFTAARNTALTSWRFRKREVQRSESLEGVENVTNSSGGGAVSPSQVLERKELREALEAALSHLSEDHRSVFLLSEVEGLKYDQIAEILNIPAGTVASRKHKATRRLKECLERNGHALS